MQLSSGWNGQPGRSRRQLAAESNGPHAFTIQCARRAHGCRAGRPTERAGGPFHPDPNRIVPAESLPENCERCCGEGFWLRPRRRGRSIPIAGCDDRANADQSQKTRRPEGFRAKGRTNPTSNAEVCSQLDPARVTSLRTTCRSTGPLTAVPQVKAGTPAKIQDAEWGDIW